MPRRTIRRGSRPLLAFPGGFVAERDGVTWTVDRSTAHSDATVLFPALSPETGRAVIDRVVGACRDVPDLRTIGWWSVAPPVPGQTAGWLLSRGFS